MRGGTTVVTVVEQIDERGHHVMLRGRLDVSTGADVRVTMRRIIQDGYLPIMLDLGEAEVGDATGFGFIVEAARCARRHGRMLTIPEASERTVRLLRRARQGHLLDLHPQTVGTLTAL